jgi:hypothetical protein
LLYAGGVKPRAIAALLPWVLGLAACGSHAAPPSGGERRSFDVVATLAMPDAGPGPSELPPTVPFTLVLDPPSGAVIAGSKGVMSAGTFASRGGSLAIGALTVGATPAGACGSSNDLVFASLDLEVTGDSLRGTGRGEARISCGDCQFNVPFSADLAGVPDATSPVLLPVGAQPSSPFASFAFAASEPLPLAATARLVGSDGAVVDLVPTMAMGDVPIVSGFSKPDVVLPPSDGFVVALDGLVDFAGHAGAADTPLRLAPFGAAPLVPADGFESAMGAELGGATVISAGAIPPITGGKSVYFGPSSAPAPPGVTVGRVLRVRLAVPPGGTKVRFSYRIISSTNGGGFAGQVRAGSVGHAATSQALGAIATGTTDVWPDGQSVWLSAVATQDVTLPRDHTDEVAVSVEAVGVGGCFDIGAVPAGLLVDDMRVE